MFWHPDKLPGNAGLQFHVHYDVSCQSQDLRIMKTENHERFVGVVQWEPREEGKFFEPTLRCRDLGPHGDSMQHLFNALWEAGFRPPKAMNNDEVIAVKNEVIAAKDENLNDLRSIISSRGS